MDFEAIFSQETILIIGAVIIAVAAWFIMKSGSKSNKADEGKIPASEPAAEQQNDIVDQAISEDNTEKEEKESPLWKIKRNILNKIRSMRKPEIEDEEDSAEREIQEMLRKGIEEPIDHTQISINTEPAVAVTEEVQESGNVDVQNESDSAEPEPAEEGVSFVNFGQDIEPFDNENKNFAKEDESTTAEESQAADQQESEESQKQSGSGGDLFSMFTEEDIEENEISKFASTLDEIKIDELLQKVEELKTHMRK